MVIQMDSRLAVVKWRSEAFLLLSEGRAASVRNMRAHMCTQPLHAQIDCLQLCILRLNGKAAV